MANPVAPSINSHVQLAQALRKLGLSADEVKTIDPTKTADPALATAAKSLLKTFSEGEWARFQNLLQDKTVIPTLAGQVGGGVLPFAVEDKLFAKKNGKEPAVKKNLQAVTDLLRTYGADKDLVVERPLERVLAHAAKIQSVLLAETDLDKRVDHVMAKDLRRQVFLLEGVARIYRDTSSPAMETFLSAKKLEDALGAYSATKSNIATADRLAKEGKPLPDAVRAVLVVDESNARRALTRILEEDWTPNKKGRMPAIERLIDGWSKKKHWGDYAKDKQHVRETLADHLKKVDGTEFRMNDLQGELGVHDLRRQLRWFPIFAEAVGGLVVLDAAKNPVEAYAPLLQDPVASSKFVVLPAQDREVVPIYLSKSLYTALMKMTLDLGAIKDDGEAVEAIAHAYLQSGTAGSAKEAHQAALQYFGGEGAEHRVFDTAAQIYKNMKENHLLQALAQDVLG